MTFWWCFAARRKAGRGSGVSPDISIQAKAEADPYGMTNKRTGNGKGNSKAQIPCGDDKQRQTMASKGRLGHAKGQAV